MSKHLRTSCVLAAALFVLAGGLRYALAAEPIPDPHVESQETQGSAAETVPAALLTTNVCPKYRTMNFGSYYTYYSLMCSSCGPTSYNTVNGNLCPGQCNGNCSTCVDCLTVSAPGAVSHLASLAASDPGTGGYGADLPMGHPEKKKKKKLKFNDIANPTPGVGVSRIDDFYIKFQGGMNESTTIYAQVFVVWVKPPIGSGEPGSIVACGIEIEDPMDDFLDATVTPIAGRDHAYDYQYGDLRIEIITHWETEGHGQ